ncbi:MAG: hypothetical protein EA379_10000 [Phycisphaerales bacterium]|jgi:uncharacterized membrane protein YedE/YeeE|nr:MAG: hypothetical protein EA379_10000 [Phycisphaerales bacterium]
MRNPLRIPRWSPYVVGAGIGMLSWATFLFMDKALGASTSFVQASGAALSVVAPEHVKANPYYARLLVGRPVVEWQMALVLMLAVGAFLSARLSGVRFVEHVPDLWARRFGPSRAKRYTFAFLGGVVLLFGARLADGCTSGHAISGGLQLAVSSWVFLIAMFVSGVAVATLMFRGKGANRV